MKTSSLIHWLLFATCIFLKTNVVLAQTNEQPKPRLIGLYDSGRHRHIPVAVYEPLKAQKKQREIVILNHGYAPESMTAYLGYSYLANLFVSLGYTVISIQQDQPEDPPMPTVGDPRVVRRPFWERGVRNINFAIAHLPELTLHGRYDKFILVGHSMGGDIVALYATLYPQQLTALITLDNRRMQLPRTKHPRVLSLRSADQPADEGTLPTEAEAKKFNMEIIKLSHTNHSDMDEHGTEEQKKEICEYIRRFLL
jgi:pimeloyl-ACP methyl ester carboxylesterase